MPFTIIRGSFHPEVGAPDGDSVRFRADNPDLIRTLPRAHKDTVKKDGTAQLRYEGVDAIEKGALQPLATQAKDKNLDLLGDDVLEASNGRLRMTCKPEDIVFEPK